MTRESLLQLHKSINYTLTPTHTHPYSRHTHTPIAHTLTLL